MLRREEIIDSVFDEEAFASLPARLAQSVGARSTILHWRHDDGGYEALGFSHFTPEWMRDYSSAWVFADPWQAAALARPNVPLVLHEVVPERAFISSPIFNDFIRPSGDDTLHCMGGRFSTSSGDGMLAVHRGAGDKAFEAADLSRLQVYSREFERLFKVRGELAAARRDSANARGALDALAWAIVIVSADARVLSANAAADRVLRRGDGLAVRRGVLCVAEGSNATLHAALQRASSAQGHVAQSQAVARPSDRLPYLVTICPLQDGRRLMLLFRDPDVEDESLVGRLRGLFGLTLAEAAVAADLAKGSALAEIAVRRGVGLNTLKTQVAAIMRKMGSRRQSEIVAIVAALPTVR
jgi:DNA-binding CsgD family transcriptional regulator